MSEIKVVPIIDPENLSRRELTRRYHILSTRLNNLANYITQKEEEKSSWVIFKQRLSRVLRGKNEDV